MDIFDSCQFPVVKNIQPRTLADDIFPYIPVDKKNNEIWEKEFKRMYNKVKMAFDEKNIPMPTVEIISDKEPVKFPGIKLNLEDE